MAAVAIHPRAELAVRLHVRGGVGDGGREPARDGPAEENKEEKVEVEEGGAGEDVRLVAREG